MSDQNTFPHALIIIKSSEVPSSLMKVQEGSFAFNVATGRASNKLKQVPNVVEKAESIKPLACISTVPVG
jgi:hypothetical protein